MAMVAADILAQATRTSADAAMSVGSTGMTKGQLLDDIELAFTLLFCAEMLFKVAVLGRRYFAVNRAFEAGCARTG